MKFLWSAIKWIGGTALTGATVDQVDDRYFDGEGKKTVANVARKALNAYDGVDSEQDLPPTNPDASASSVWDKLKQGELSEALDDTTSIISNKFNESDANGGAENNQQSNQNQNDKDEESDLTENLLTWLGIGGATLGGGYTATKLLGAMFNNNNGSDSDDGMGIVTKLAIVGVVLGIIMNWKTIDNTLGISEKFDSITGGSDDESLENNNDSAVDFTSQDTATFEMS